MSRDKPWALISRLLDLFITYTPYESRISQSKEPGVGGYLAGSWKEATPLIIVILIYQGKFNSSMQMISSSFYVNKPGTKIVINNHEITNIEATLKTKMGEPA